MSFYNIMAVTSAINQGGNRHTKALLQCKLERALGKQENSLHAENRRTQMRAHPGALDRTGLFTQASPYSACPWQGTALRA